MGFEKDSKRIRGRFERGFQKGIREGDSKQRLQTVLETFLVTAVQAFAQSGVTGRNAAYFKDSEHSGRGTQKVLIFSKNPKIQNFLEDRAGRA